MRKNNKKKIIIALVALALCMGIGYSILSQQLKIEGTVTTDSKFDVEITGIERFDNIGTLRANGIGASWHSAYSTSNKVVEVQEPTYTATTANFNVRLEFDTSITYLVTIENKGSITAIFDAPVITKEGNQNITLETPIDIENVTLESGQKIQYLVKLSNSFSNDLSEEVESNISIKLNSKQVGMAGVIKNVRPYILFKNYDTDIDSPSIAVLNGYGTYGNSTNLYLSVDDGEYEVVEYIYHQEGNSSYGSYNGSGDFIFTIGDNLKSQLQAEPGVHSLKLKLGVGFDGNIDFESNEIEYLYYAQ